MLHIRSSGCLWREREGEEEGSLHELPGRAARTFSDRCRESAVRSGTLAIEPLEFGLDACENQMLKGELQGGVRSAWPVFLARPGIARSIGAVVGMRTRTVGNTRWSA